MAQPQSFLWFLKMTIAPSLVSQFFFFDVFQSEKHHFKLLAHAYKASNGQLRANFVYFPQVRNLGIVASASRLLICKAQDRQCQR